MNILSEIDENFPTKIFRKNESLISNQKICKHILLIKKGLVKLSTYKNDNEFILNFFKENEFCTVIDSLVSIVESDCEIIAIEETTATIIDFEKFQNICNKNSELDYFLRNLIANSSVALIKRVKELLLENPEKRYKNFTLQHSEIMQRISLGEVAKYVGISQVSLSRIRAKK